MILIGKWIAGMMDYVLGWMLLLPRDLAVVLIAVGTSIVLTLARKVTTDQDLMHRCAADLKRLKQLKTRARANRDKKQVRNIATTVGMIQMIRMRSEGWGMLVSLVPIILLASWAFERLDFLPAQVDEPLKLAVTYPESAIGTPTFVTVEGPDRDKITVVGLTPATQPDQWVEHRLSTLQNVRLDPVVGPAGPNGLATWQVTSTGPVQDAVLRVVYGGREIRHPVKFGGRQYGSPLQLHDEEAAWPECTSQMGYRQSRFLGYVPIVNKFWDWWESTGWNQFFAPWMLAYLLITIPFVPLLRKVMNIK